MAEDLPGEAREAADKAEELNERLAAPSTRAPQSLAAMPKGAKITVPLLDENEVVASTQTPHITRPLSVEDIYSPTATVKLPDEKVDAKTTRPLAPLLPDKCEDVPDVAVEGAEATSEQLPLDEPSQAISILTSIVPHTEPPLLLQVERQLNVATMKQADRQVDISPAHENHEPVVQKEAEEEQAQIIFAPTMNKPGASKQEDTQPRLKKIAPTLQSVRTSTSPAQPVVPSQLDERPFAPTPISETAPLTPVLPLVKQRELALAQQHTQVLQPRVYSHVALSQRRLKRIYRLQYFSRKHLRRARAHEYRERKRLWITIWTTTSSLLLLFLILVSVTSYIAYNFIVVTQGTYAGQVLSLRSLLPPDNLKIYDAQGTLIDQLTDQGIHTQVPYKQIAPDLIDATVAIEDRTFWQNSGVDLTGIVRAAFADLESGEAVQGGSTITQQLVKQLIVGNAGDAQRKLSELVLAPQVNSHYSKQDILEMYLNTIYYGHQAYGIDAAATVFFGLEDKPGQSAASQLDLAQAAFLAGLPRNASLYDPAVHPIAAYSRFYNVLQAMVAQHYITQVQAQSAYQEGQASNFFHTSPILQDQAPHFDEYVLTQLEQMFHLTRAQLSRSGLVVKTTVNVALQKQIQTIMQQHIAEIRAAHHVTNAAEVLIDFHTGAIISMQGSLDYNDSAIDGQYNVALAYRQPGSSFKPYVYITAFAQGASPAQAVDDASTTFNVPDSQPPTYTPSNYDQHFHGHMTLRCALQNSLNVPAVRVLQHVGINNAMATAQEMGITSYEGTPGLSLVLGGLDVRLLDHTSAFGVFANNGVRQPYYSISSVIQGTTGKVLFQHQQGSGTQVISPQLAYMMTSVLSDNTSRTPEFFDCNVLQLYANSQQNCYAGNRGAVRPAAAKTGTTQDFRDNWTLGYTTDYVMGVWAGNDDNSPMINVTGVQGAAPIWHDAMLLAEQGHPIQDFANPGGLQRATVTYPDGVTSSDWFLPGSVPPNAQPTPQPDPNQDNPPEDTSATPYCSTYSYAFQPPANGGIPANGAWW